MAPKIYRSPFPNVPVHNSSVFTHLFSSSVNPALVGAYPGSDIAYVDAPTGTILTRAQVKSFALQLAHSLQNHPNLQAKRGDTVLIYSHNSLSWPVALFGSVAAGLRCTLANDAYNVRELSFQYADSGANIVFTSEEGVPVVLEMLRDLKLSEGEVKKRIIVLTTSLHWAGNSYVTTAPTAKGLVTLANYLSRGSLRQEERFDGELANETVYLCYSSGTTGKPKGVETTHRNINAVLDQVRPAFPVSDTGKDRMLGILPFYHIYGAVKLVQFPLSTGMSVIIMPRFNPIQFLENIEKYKITAALIVPPVLVVLSRLPVLNKYDLSSLEILFSGAAPLGAALTRQVKEQIEALRTNGKEVYIMQGYGLTETSPTTHLLCKGDAVRKVGSIGTLLPNLEARLVIDGNGDGLTDAEQGQPGELWIRGPSVMKGYHKNELATQDSITRDGWFKTGDIAIIDCEGFYNIVDRKKELIKYKGFQVPPAELESVLLMHPDIADTAVIGVESIKEATEFPRAYIVPVLQESVKTKAQQVAFAQSIQKWVQSKVARHKYLRGGVIVIDAIPKSAAGKILRRELRNLAKAELAGRDPADDIIRPKL